MESSEKRTDDGGGGAAAGAPAGHDRPLIRDGAIHGVSPLDGTELPPVPVSSDEAVHEAVEQARRAQRIWRNQPLEDRVAALKKAAKAMLDRRAELLQLVKREVGKLEVDALFTEALGPLDAVGGWARVVGKTVDRRVRLNPLSFPKKRARIQLVPRGVVGIIAPWNYPVAGLYRSLIPALITGNAVVLKPSEHSPKSSQWFADRLAEALPEGLVQVVHGDGAAGRALLESGLDACVFTGSCGTGAKVRVRCAELGIPCSVEMGGNDPAIVLADCDLDRTVAGITHWSLHNAGQACGAIELAYVDTRIADTFVRRLADAWRRLRVGEGDFGEVEVSPLSNARQLAIVEAHVEDAVEKGATLVTGGARVGPGLFYAPTLLDHCTDEMDVVKDETFGPVLAIVRVDGAAEAIRRTNEGRYGLGASIWTTDIARAGRLADRLDVGVVDVNNHAMTGAIPDLPWSGVRDTGFGIANSELSLTTFCRPKSLLIDENAQPEPFWMPFDPTAFELGDILADAQMARVGRAWKLPLLLQKRMKRIKRFFGG
ncbi:MAG TPA: aldehyde dehydrogenase family protein [Sandaracinaceae bacterium LLY-WYZ-13_1]|nr:aldehyde dehydrogenase family protein [Sandaracinaceae bacterium LLY-WYZ-13_1]